VSTNVLRGAAIVLLIAAVIVAAIAFFMPGGASSPTLGERHGAPSDQPANNVDVVVAAHDLAPFVSLTADDLDRVQMPPPDRAYFSDIDDLIGRMPSQAVANNDVLARDALITFSELAQLVPAGMQAVSIPVNDAVSAGGFVGPGDMVDVLLYLPARGQEVEQSQARVLLAGLRLLAFRNRLLDQTDEAAAKNDTGRQTTAVLAVPRDQVPRLVLGEEVGQLRLALIGETDARRMAQARLGKLAASGVDRDGPGTSLTLRELTGAPPDPAESRRSRPTRPAQRSAPRPTIQVFRGNESSRVAVP